MNIGKKVAQALNDLRLSGSVHCAIDSLIDSGLDLVILFSDLTILATSHDVKLLISKRQKYLSWYN